MDRIALAKLIYNKKKEYEYCMSKGWQNPVGANNHFLNQAKRLRRELDQLEKHQEEGTSPPASLTETPKLTPREIEYNEEQKRIDQKEDRDSSFRVALIILLTAFFVIIIGSCSSGNSEKEEKRKYLKAHQCNLSDITPTLETKSVGAKTSTVYYKWNENYICNNGKMSFSVWKTEQPYRSN